ncbi:LacI family DNA-binding transcriptional regulator [Isoptericola sp. NPDC019571]|uniref:LacI family DNA-binding transcriptional regulator n=1 Tax=Isoptericola sp. NPDC019571 TaxID=3364008 RepID=UPI0037ADB3D8
MVSIYDVARSAKVSPATVSNFLNRPRKVAPTTAARIAAVIDELGFVPRLSARQLRWGRSGIVGICVVNASNPYFAEVVRAAEIVLAAEGAAVVVASSYELAERQSRLLGMFEELRFDGILVTPTDGELEQLRQIQARGTPLVLMDHADPQGSIPGIVVDHAAGGRAAAEHLLSIGRRSFWVATGPAGIQQTARREEGFRKMIEAVPGTSLKVVRSSDLGLREGQDIGRRVATEAPGARPDAIFAANDMHALGLERALLECGIPVPEEVALVGYDDIPFAECAAVPLTTLRQPSLEIGTAAARLVLSRPGTVVGADPAGAWLPELVIRASTNVAAASAD